MSSYPDPAYHRQRACNGVDQDVFFMTGAQQVRMRKAQAICASCPVLAACARWAAPMVRDGALTACVVAGVYAPRDHASADDERAAAADELAFIAGRLDVEGAA